MEGSLFEIGVTKQIASPDVALLPGAKATVALIVITECAVGEIRLAAVLDQPDVGIMSSRIDALHRHADRSLLAIVAKYIGSSGILDQLADCAVASRLIPDAGGHQVDKDRRAAL